MDENRRVLVVDDNKDIHEDFRKILIQEREETDHLDELEETLFNKKHEVNIEFTCHIDHAYQGDEAILKVSDAVRENRPYALIFMDVRMPPGIDGIEAIYRIWREHPLVEVVICTAYSDYTWNEIIGKLGTTDKLLFIKKPFNAVEIKQMTLSLIKKWNTNNRLNRLVKKLEGEVQERTKQLNALLMEIREKNRALQELARRDSLTGLYNHAALYEHLNANLSGAKRHGYPLSVVLLDIDHFAELNHTYGHETGDQVLQQTAASLRQSLRLYDVTLRYLAGDSEVLKEELARFNVAGRYGGDEFICIIPHCGIEGARTLAERLQEKITSLQIPGLPAGRLSLSLGSCVLKQEVRCEDSRKLIELADRALSQSKAKGGGQSTLLEYS